MRHKGTCTTRWNGGVARKATVCALLLALAAAFGVFGAFGTAMPAFADDDGAAGGDAAAVPVADIAEADLSAATLGDVGVADVANGANKYDTMAQAALAAYPDGYRALS